MICRAQGSYRACPFGQCYANRLDGIPSGHPPEERDIHDRSWFVRDLGGHLPRRAFGKADGTRGRGPDQRDARECPFRVEYAPGFLANVRRRRIREDLLTSGKYGQVGWISTVRSCE